jgi:Fic-DOC domain mobile mystery protein B
MGAPLADGNGDGETPLDENESEGLIPSHITKRSELNGWEAANIRDATEWSDARTPDVLRVTTLSTLHRRMFDKTWTWAGHYRTSDKSISPFAWSEVPRLVNDLVENTKAQYDYSDRSPAALDAIAARFHHQLVWIHPWPNGNGRHARLATDLLLRRWGRPPFSWGSASPHPNTAALRQEYLHVLRAADGGHFEALSHFVRS